MTLEVSSLWHVPLNNGSLSPSFKKEEGACFPLELARNLFMIRKNYSTAIETARNYYNSKNANNFYMSTWGGEDIHIGIYKNATDSIGQASRCTVKTIASLVKLKEDSRLLDIGCGYGGPARYLAKTKGCHVDCLNLSEVQNQRNWELTQQQGLTHKIRVVEGSFEEMPLESQQYDLVYSQDALLHSGDRQQVFQEVRRILKPQGEFIFTDPMQSDECPQQALQPVLERIHLASMGSLGFYTKTAYLLGFETIEIIEMTNHLITHYRRVLEELETRYHELLELCEQDYLDRMKVGLQHWIEAGQKGYLVWGILHFRKK